MSRDQHPTPTGAERETVPVVVVVLVLAIVSALGALGVRALLAEPPAAAAPSHPDRWDPRVRPLVKVAERQRDLGFLHPVRVRFLAPRAFEKTLAAEPEDVQTQREEAEHHVATLRALGLLEGDLDLVRTLERTRSAGVLAYYSFEDQTVTVRGKRLTPAVRQTLVHELVHVLQDQNFGVGAELERLAEAEEETSGTAAAVLRALVEGDARRVEHRYARSLPAPQRQALARGAQRDLARAERGLEEVPDIVVSLFTSPYVLGQGLVDVAAAAGGGAAVDDLLRDPPEHDAVLLDPLRVLVGDDEAAAVAVPSLTDGEELLHAGELGALTWYLMLAERMPALGALRTVDGWDGDSYAAFTRDGTACVRATYVGRDEGASARMRLALERWAQRGPRSQSEVEREGRKVRLESCDPGKRARGAGRDASQAALQLVAVRAALGRSLVAADLPRLQAQCLADRVVGEYPVRRLTDPGFGADDPAVQARMRQLAASCADGG